MMTREPRKLDPGTLTHGTVKPVDVVPILLRKLEEVTDSESVVAPYFIRYLRAINELDEPHAPEGTVTAEDNEAELMRLWDDLVDALQAYAPEGYYVGIPEGDTPDVGVWPQDGEE